MTDLSPPEPTARQRAQQERLDQAARDEFDDFILNGARAWRWVRDRIIDTSPEIQRLVNAAIWHVRLPQSEDAHFELCNAVDALRECYVAEREWHWSDYRDEPDYD